MYKFGAMIVLVVSLTAAKSLQSCPTLCDPTDGSPPGSPVPGIPQARTLEWVALSFSNAWKWKVKVKSLSRVWLYRPHGLQPTRLLCPWDSPGENTGVGCHVLLQRIFPTKGSNPCLSLTFPVSTGRFFITSTTSLMIHVFLWYQLCLLLHFWFWAFIFCLNLPKDLTLLFIFF